MDIYKVVFTGGPCSGKSKTVSEMKKRLEEDGYDVVLVSETARELDEYRKGLYNNNKDVKLYQQMILDFQSLKERCAYIYAKNIYCLKPIIILFDRAILDNRAYLESDEIFDNMLSKKGLNEIEISNSYDLVIDFISLSSLKPDLYKSDNERIENPKAAAELDRKTSEAWMTSENMIIIKPTDNINEKYSIVYEKIKDLISNSAYKKGNDADYNMSDIPQCKHIKNSKTVSINEYMVKAHELCKLRKIGYKNSNAYLLGKILIDEEGSMLEYRNKSISESTFNYILENSELKGNRTYQRLNYIDDDFNLIRIDHNDKMEKAIDDNGSCLVLKK